MTFVTLECVERARVWLLPSLRSVGACVCGPSCRSGSSCTYTVLRSVSLWPIACCADISLITFGPRQSTGISMDERLSVGDSCYTIHRGFVLWHSALFVSKLQVHFRY